MTEVCKYLGKMGYEITYVPVDRYGTVNPEDVENAIRSETALITIMHANNEVGTIQPVKEIACIAKKNKIAFHTDAAQSVGK
ncbi:MAG: aminotransferase class V-fold PLP-dependent enzyme [Cyclobacteriaceae bacterium]|nr:aminotransferase class V-fold PLP-dependent enzyme [Cyclobacteriaceae bacterium]